MALVWDETFILGIDEIDQQHKTIIEQFSRLSDAVQSGDSSEALAEMTRFLVEYATMHFATEEKYMQQYGYPDIEIQRNEHAEFTCDADMFMNKIDAEGASRKLGIEISGKMVKWLINHVRNHDRDMVDYVRGEMAKQGRSQEGGHVQ